MEVAANKVTNADAETFFLTLMYTWHMGSRWCTSDLHVVATDNEAFIPPWHPAQKKLNNKGDFSQHNYLLL